MKTKIQKLAAGFLIFAISMGILPGNIQTVWADVQNPITELTIQEMSGTVTDAGAPYDVILNWRRPHTGPRGGRMDAGTHHAIGSLPIETTDRGRDEPPEFFRITYENRTPLRITEPHVAVPRQQATAEFGQFGDNWRGTINNMQMGSIYLFYVEPFHYHYRHGPIPGTQPPIYGWMSTEVAPVARGPRSQALFMTDIYVDVQAGDQGLVVTWDNPVFNKNGVNHNVATGFRLFWAIDEGPNPVPMHPLGHPVFRDVQMNDPDLVVLPDGRLQYTIRTDLERLEVGRLYSVKVEPLYNRPGTPGGMLLRDQTNIVIVGGESYSIAYSHMLQREFRSNRVGLSPQLFLQRVGEHQLRLFWDRVPRMEDITRIEILSGFSEDTSAMRVIGNLAGTFAQRTTFWTTEVPERIPTFYAVRFIFAQPGQDPSVIYTNVREFNPDLIDYWPYSPTILHTVEMPDHSAGLNLRWRAFVRPPFTEAERELIDPRFGTNVIVDRNMSYYVWITDQLENLYWLPSVPGSPFPASALGEPGIGNFIGEFEPVVYFNRTFNQYQTTDADGQVVVRNIEPNRVYYIRIVAVRDETGAASQSAYGSIFVPPTDDLDMIPQMMARPPLRVRETTEDTITIEWYTQWSEVHYRGMWHSRIGVDQDGDVVLGSAIDRPGVTAINLHGYAADRAQIIARLREAGLDEAMAQGIGQTTRVITLGPETLYEIHVVEYDAMLEGHSTYEAYLNMLLSNPEMWEEIVPTGIDGIVRYADIEDLEPNTAYVIFFRPFIMVDGEPVHAYYPVYVTDTTLNVRPPLDIIPTIPVLEPVEAGFHWLVVRWRAHEALSYRLSFSHLITDFPDNGTDIMVNWDDIPSDNVWVEGDYIYHRITGLFPETMYYLWIRAIAGPNVSAPSNPIEMETTEVDAPAAPRGLGRAGINAVNAYNAENATEYAPITESSIIMEWNRIAADINNPYPPVGASGSGEGSPNARWMQSALFRYTRLVIFEELQPNRPYYFRARTVLNVSAPQRGEPITISYSYIVQASLTSDFTDVIYIIVPEAPPADGPLSITRESEWSPTVRIATGTWDGEYDGEWDYRFFPLPVEDVEITYDEATQTLRVRFRSTQIGADGNPDNQVDQRFISRLLAANIFDFYIDMSYFEGRPISNRVVEIPMSIYSAFDEQRISLSIQAAETRFTLPPGSLNTAQVQQMAGRTAATYVTLQITDNVAGTPVLLHDENFVTTPRTLSARVATPQQTVNVSNFAEEINVTMTMANRYAALEDNLNAHFANANSGGWQPLATNVDQVAGTVSVSSRFPGNYVLISRPAPMTTIGDPFRDSFFTVHTRLNIVDLYEFRPHDHVTANAFNNIVAAIAHGRPSVVMSADMSQADFNALGRRGVLVSGHNVTNQAGISALVELYQVKTRAPVRNFPSLQESMFPDIALADATYHTNLLRAEALGFIDGSTVNPRGWMTMGELMYILEAIILDAGL